MLTNFYKKNESLNFLDYSLKCAIKAENLTMIEYLYTSVNQTKIIKPYTIFMLACRKNNVAILQCLWNKGFRPTWVNFEVATAATLGNFDILRFIQQKNLLEMPIWYYYPIYIASLFLYLLYYITKPLQQYDC